MAAAICNASPLIVLAKAGYLDVLNQLFDRVLVPVAVKQEVLAGPTEDPARVAVESGSGIEVVTLEPAVTPLAYWRLGRGETEVIEYARLHPGTVALLDDLSARRAAEALGVPVLGTLGLLARALKGEPDAFGKEAVERLEAAGLRVANNVVAEVVETLKRENRR